MASSVALPPGPWKLPLLGSIHHMATGLPHRALASLAREHGPVMHMKLGEVDLIVISSPDAAREVLKTHDANFARRPALAAGKALAYNCSDVVFSDGPLWRELRKMCRVELLGPNRVKSFAPIRRQEMRALLKDISEAPFGTPVNLSAKLMSLTNSIACRSTFGDKLKHKEKFLSLLEEAIEVMSGFSISDVFPSLSFLDVGLSLRFRRISRELDKILEEVVQERLRQRPNKAKEEEDLVDVLLRAREQPDLEVPITIDTVKAVIMDMFGGGTETSASAMVWAMAELVRNPRVLATVQNEVRALMKKKGKTEVEEEDLAELTYLNQVILETLRLHPAIPLLVPRECREQCLLLGYMIPARARVVVNTWSIGRDPQYWDDADSFVPERFAENGLDHKGANFEYLPFGAGRRICPGMGFALASVSFGLASLLFHFDWALPNWMQSPEDLDMKEEFGATVAKEEPLELLPMLYDPFTNAL